MIAVRDREIGPLHSELFFVLFFGLQSGVGADWPSLEGTVECFAGQIADLS